MTFIEQNHHTIMIIEHDLLLYEDARVMTECVSQVMRETAKEAAVFLYAPGADPYMKELIANADRIFYFDEGARAEARVAGKSIPRK
jgi:hypothetical protein